MKTQIQKKTPASLFSFAIIACSMALTACGDSSLTNNDPNQAVDQQVDGGTSTATVSATGSTTHVDPTPTSTPVAAATPSGLDAEGYKTCVTSDTNHICIGLKIVSYLNNGTPSISEAAAITMVAGMNTVWDQCNIGYQLESYTQVDPTTKGLSYSPNWQTEATSVRSAFAATDKFVVIAVGTLSGSTIAVTEMPGGSPYGTLVESAYASNPLTVGHELGHYQGLYHISDSSNLMNPYIGTNTSGLTSSQCSTARSTDNQYWQAMMRN